MHNLHAACTVNGILTLDGQVVSPKKFALMYNLMSFQLEEALEKIKKLEEEKLSDS